MTEAEKNVEMPFAPERTSIAQVAAGIKKSIKMGLVESGMFTVDVGGGKYDYGIDYLREHGITDLVYDPYARGYTYNKDVLDKIYSHSGADAAFLNNVINVIPNEEERQNAIRFSYDLLKPGGILIITTYEGDRSSIGKTKEYKTGWTWQANRPTREYEDEIKDVLPHALIEFRSKMYIIKKNISGNDESSYQTQMQKAMEFDEMIPKVLKKVEKLNISKTKI